MGRHTALVTWAYNARERRGHCLVSPPVFLWIVALVILIVCVVRIAGRGSTVDTRLLSACLGDREQVERLVELEMRLRPSLSRRQAVSMALARIQRDNR
jgi:hypothetical protein